MNGRPGNNDFEELEPRVTPQPTLLKCMTAPSVPEVSMIFGKPSIPIQDSKESRNTPNKQYETYANWKKDEYPGATVSKSDSRYSRQLFERSTINGSPSQRKSTSNKPTNYISPINDNKFHENHRQNRLNELQTVATIDRTENQHFHNYQRSATSSNKSVESPCRKKSNDAVKSILKSPQNDRTESTNPDCLATKQMSSCTNQYPRNIPNSEYSVASPNSRCHRQSNVDPDRETVRDLLLLVKNQNEQIKSLQNQVERLLLAHEETMGYRESRNAISKNTCDTISSPTYVRDDRTLASNGTPSQKPPHRGSTRISKPHTSEESADLCLRCPNDQQIRNAIVEKKVSIGVMTSFEFSVHNNPFVADSDPQINAVLRECGKTMGDGAESWLGKNHCSRNIVVGPLENINEDSEGYPSSLWKQSNNTTQSSSNDKFNHKKNPIIRDNKIYRSDNNRNVEIMKNIELRSNDDDSAHFFNKSAAQTPVPAPRRSLSNNTTNRIVPTLPDERMRAPTNLDNHRLNDVVETYDSHRINDRNDYNRTTMEKRREDLPRNFDISKSRIKSMGTEIPDEGSLVLSSSDLRVNERPPSPDPSIHVEMREYSSDEDDEKSRIAHPVGWTFYKNIVGQVNRILHTIPDSKALDANEVDDVPDVRADVDVGEEQPVDSVKLATLERLKMLGISFAEHSEFMGEHVQKKVTFDSSYCPRLDYQTNLPQSTSTVTESNTSMHMKALALKYLSDEQLAELAVQKQGDASGVKHKIMNGVHGTNMSMATMNYLQRYCMVSGVNTSHAEGKEHINTIRQKKMKHVVMTKEVHAQPMPRHQAFNDSGTKKGPDNILDITTLKQQPKLM